MSVVTSPGLDAGLLRGDPNILSQAPRELPNYHYSGTPVARKDPI